MEHTTTGLPIDNRLSWERGVDIIQGRGYVEQSQLLRLALPGGRGEDLTHVWRQIKANAETSGTVQVIWTRYGAPFYCSALHALQLAAAGRITWVEDKGETVPTVQAPADFAL